MYRFLQILLMSIIPVSIFAVEGENWLTPDSFDVSFEATAEMRELLDHPSLSSTYSDLDRARNIVDILFGKDGKGFTYDATLTLAPREAFEVRRGNCITFAMLFTTLAREAGLRTRFNEVNNSPGWNHNGSLVVETGHVNVVVRSNWQQFVVEWLDNYRDFSVLGVRTVNDDRIRSDFFNNLAIQALAANQLDQAYSYFEYALSHDSKNPSVWQNLGVFWLHKKDPQKAEAAFLNGVQYAGKGSTASYLLGKLYQQQGKIELSEKYFKKAERSARRNPFYHYQLAVEDVASNKIKDAKTHLAKAIKKLPNYSLFHFTKAQCHEALGEIEKWESELQLAINLTRSPETAEHYKKLLMDGKMRRTHTQTSMNES